MGQHDPWSDLGHVCLCHEERDPKIDFLFDNNSFVSQTAEVMVTYNIPVCPCSIVNLVAGMPRKCISEGVWLMMVCVHTCHTLCLHNSTAFQMQPQVVTQDLTGFQARMAQAVSQGWAGIHVTPPPMDTRVCNSVTWGHTP